MTLTMAHEMATQRTGRTGRPFTAAEDDTLRRLAAEGHTRRQIATAMGRQYHSVRHRARLLNVDVEIERHAPLASQFDQALPRCRRCTILLSAAPAGHGDLCGWCANDN
jgi:hypothetical protein